MKKEQFVPSGADHGRKMHAARLLGQPWFKECSRWRRSFRFFDGSRKSRGRTKYSKKHLFLNKFIQRRWLQRKIAQKCLEMLLCTDCIFLHQTKKRREKTTESFFFFFFLFLWATFVTKSNFWATFLEISSNLWKILPMMQYVLRVLYIKTMQVIYSRDCIMLQGTGYPLFLCK